MKSYYPHALEILEREILNVFPGAKPNENAIDTDMPSYLLWMIEKMKTFDTTSFKDAFKAARWLGWIWRVIESELKLWDNARSRELTRIDVKAGYDMPIKKGEAE